LLWRLVQPSSGEGDIKHSTFQQIYVILQDDIPERSVMQVLPIQGIFTVVRSFLHSHSGFFNIYSGKEVKGGISVSWRIKKTWRSIGSCKSLGRGHRENRSKCFLDQDHGNCFNCSRWLNQPVKCWKKDMNKKIMNCIMNAYTLLFLLLLCDKEWMNIHEKIGMFNNLQQWSQADCECR
jgi:hypothetical protein